MNNALITVTGYQCSNGEQDCIELKTLGKFGIKDGKYYVKYTEETETKATCDTLIKIDGDEAVISKSGDTDCRMIIKVGKRNTCCYTSSGNALILDIYGLLVESNLNNSGGSLSLEYELNMNFTPISKNRIEITVKEV